MISFTIIICTYNGNSRLPKTVEKLCGLKLNDSIKVDVLIIDNASTDPYEQSFNSWYSTYHKKICFKYLYESQKGKDFAISTGVKMATGDWIVVCDDDNWLDADFLITAAKLINEFKDLAAIGAKSVPSFEHGYTPPKWFEESALQYACGKQYQHSGYVNYRQVIWGAGSIYSKNILDITLNSTKLLLSNRRGEDAEIFYRILLLGGKVYYSNELCFEHFMPANRLFEEKHIQMMYFDAQSKIVLDKYNKFIKYYVLNNKKLISLLKWNFIGLLIKLKFIRAQNEKQKLLLEIYGMNSLDNDFIGIRDFYTKAKHLNL